MSAFRAICLRESVELGPAYVVTIAIGVWLGSQPVPFLGVAVVAWPYLGLGAAVVGVVQGAIDRLRVADAFDRHRPVDASIVQSARWLAGLLVIAAMFGALLATHWTRAALTYSDAVDRARAATPAVHGWRLLLVGLGISILAWITLRITVSWRGAITPMVLSALLPVALGIAVARAAPHMALVLVPAVILFSLYQGVRLSGVRQ